MARTITNRPNHGGPCHIDLTEHLHLPTVDGETGAITILLGLDGIDHDEVRLALGDGRAARDVLGQAIEALLACRASLNEEEGR